MGAGERGECVLALVIPAYNEETTIAEIAARALDRVATVIVVDDGSSDATAASLDGLPVTLIRHAENRGKAAALVTGFDAALAMGATHVLTMDGDGQHRPEDIARLCRVGLAMPGAIVIGSRLHDRENFPAHRLRANEIANFWISWAAGHRIEDSQSGFRLYPAEVLSLVSIPHGRGRGFVFESEILIAAARLGYRTVSVPIPALYGKALQRPSHFRPLGDITRIVLMVAWKLIKWGMYPMGLWRVMKSYRA